MPINLSKYNTNKGNGDEFFGSKDKKIIVFREFQDSYEVEI